MTVNDIKDEFPLKLDLQHFGGSGEPNPEGGEPNPDDLPGGTNPKPDDVDPKKLTEEEINKKIEAESDRKLTSAKAKWEQEQDTKTQKAIKNALAEDKRLSKLSQVERENETLTQREQDLQTREADIAKKLLRSETVDDLQKKELPSDFADFLLGADAESTLENVNTFKKSFDGAVNAAVKEALRQETPRSGSGSIKGNAPSIAKIAQENRIIK